MNDKSSVLQIIGSLMKHPQYLSEVDKYNLTPFDFSSRFEKNIFIAIDTLYRNGATNITPVDIENFLETNAAAKTLFNQQNGIEYLQDASFMAEEGNFPYYYNRLKKINLLNSLQKQGINTSDFYMEDLTDPKAIEINRNFENLEIKDVFDALKKKLLGVEREYNQNDTTEVRSAFENVEDILEDAENKADIGLPLQGEIFNEVVSGARTGALYIRSGGSGVSKTRQAVGDACYLAYPIRYDMKTQKWAREGNNQKILFIATEQDFKEITKMILAYLTGFNESRFRYGNFSTEEKIIINQAIKVMDQYKDNFFIVRMPNPTIELIKTIVRENCLVREINYVFYDYIFIGPSLLSEFKGFNLRNDEVLLMFATALKDLAVELQVFVMTSTQVNANADNNSNIRNESSLAGSRSIINKADVGAIMARPTKEELETLQSLTDQLGIEPNIVTDIYKVRSGAMTQVRIWSYVDLGNLRKQDLFMTDSRLFPIQQQGEALVLNWELNNEFEISEFLKELQNVRN